MTKKPSTSSWSNSPFKQFPVYFFFSLLSIHFQIFAAFVRIENAHTFHFNFFFKWKYLIYFVNKDYKSTSQKPLYPKSAHPKHTHRSSLTHTQESSEFKAKLAILWAAILASLFPKHIRTLYNPNYLLTFSMRYRLGAKQGLADMIKDDAYFETVSTSKSPLKETSAICWQWNKIAHNSASLGLPSIHTSVYINNPNYSFSRVAC